MEYLIHQPRFRNGAYVHFPSDDDWQVINPYTHYCVHRGTREECEVIVRQLSAGFERQQEG